MKKNILLLLMALLLTFSCLSFHESKRSEIISHNESVVLVGLIENGFDNRICIVVNWESRSRVSYYIGSDFYEEISQNIGKIIRVRGYITREYEDNPWRKEFRVDSIISIK